MKLRHLYQFIGRFTVTSVALCVLASLFGCNQQEATTNTPPRPLKAHSIRVMYPPEARQLMMSAVERFNAKNIPLSDESVARLSASSFDDLASIDKIGSSQLPTSLWIAPWSPLVAIPPKGLPAESTLADCSSIMSTRLGLSFRAIDKFVVPANDQVITDHNSPRLFYVQGSPRFNSSGLLAALSLSKYVPFPSEDLSPETIARAEARIRDSQKSVRNYFISDLETLNWLNERQAGDPLLAITTEQSYKTHLSYTTQTTLELKPLSEELTLDYPLCTIASKADSEEDIGAAKAVRDFLTSKEFQEMATSFGFAPAVNQKSHPNLGRTARALLASWPKIRRPAMTVFVLDASIRTDRPTIETIRREIKLFIESRPSPDDTVALVSASTSPEILSEPQTSTESLNNALNKISTSGGNAIRDGIQTAFTIFTDLTSLNYRRSVIVFTSGKDIASQTSLTRLTNRASQLVGRKGVDLFVIGFGSATADFGELPALTKDFGGTFIRTTNATFPADFFPIARRVQ